MVSSDVNITNSAVRIDAGQYFCCCKSGPDLAEEVRCTSGDYVSESIAELIIRHSGGNIERELGSR
jgi:hypothetical protein